MAEFRVVIAGLDVTPNFFLGGRSLVEEIRVTDKSGSEADTATLVLDDAGGQIAFPSRGDEMTIALAPALGGGPVVCFEGFIDEIRSRGARGQGRQLTIEGKSADVRKSGAKEPRQRHVDEKPFEEAARALAEGTGLEISVHADLAKIVRPYWAMVNQSFLAWGASVAAELGATFKVIGQRAVFVPRNDGKSASGAPLPGLRAEFGVNLISWDVAPDLGRPGFAAFEVRYYDVEKARWVTQRVGARQAQGDAAQIARFTEADKESAERRAEALKRESEREKGEGTVVIEGDPTAAAEAEVEIVGARPGIDGPYRIETAEHAMTRSSGYLTTLTIRKPDGEKAGQDARGAQGGATPPLPPPRPADL